MVKCLALIQFQPSGQELISFMLRFFIRKKLIRKDLFICLFIYFKFSFQYCILHTGPWPFALK